MNFILNFLGNILHTSLAESVLVVARAIATKETYWPCQG